MRGKEELSMLIRNLWPELVLVEEEVGYKETVVVLGWTKVVEKVVFLVLVEDEV